MMEWRWNGMLMKRNNSKHKAGFPLGDIFRAQRLLFVVSNFRRLRSAPRGVESRIDFNFSVAHNGASQLTLIFISQLKGVLAPRNMLLRAEYVA